MAFCLQSSPKTQVAILRLLDAVTSRAYRCVMEKQKDGTQPVEQCGHRITFDMVCLLPKGHSGSHHAEYRGGQPKPPPTETAPSP
jgi:hypothetical protein